MGEWEVMKRNRYSQEERNKQFEVKLLKRKLAIEARSTKIETRRDSWIWANNRLSYR